MFLQQRIGSSLGSVILKKETQKLERNRVMKNLRSASSLGVLFLVDSFDTLKTVKDFLDTLLSEQKKVYALCFIEDKRILEELKTDSSLNIITRRDFNWFNKPINPLIKDFIEKEFDILINLCLVKALPIDFIVSLSRARMKVGKFTSDKDAADVMIDMGENESDLKFLIDQLYFYLSVINENV